MRRFWYFDVLEWSGEKSCSFLACAKMVFWLHTARTESPDTPKHIQAPLISMNTTQISPDTPQISHRHPPDISREQDMQTDNNRRQLTPPDILKQCLSVFWGVWRCLLASVGMSCSLDIYGGCLWDVCGVSWGIWVVFMQIGGVGCIWRVSALSVPAEWSQDTILASALNGTTFVHLTILRSQNTKTAAYQLSENDWVWPFFNFLGLPEKNHLLQLLLKLVFCVET